MKKIIVLSLILSISLNLLNKAHSEECQKCTYIKIIIDDKRDLEPDILSINVGINTKASKESEVINMLGEADKYVRDLGVDYKGGRFSVYKNCWWENNKTKCEGFKGDMRYTFELKNFSDQNKIYEKFSYLSNKYKDKFDFNVSEPQWIVSKNTLSKVEDELKLSVIDRAKHFADQVSKKINKVCDIKNLDYELNKFIPIPIYTMKAMEHLSAPEPKKESSSVEIKVKTEIICR